MGTARTSATQRALVLDLAKGILLVAIFALRFRRSIGLAVVFGIAWGGLPTFSATHATVSSAIGAIERTGTWKMGDP